MSLIECSVPEELLRREEHPFDEPTKFGLRVAYFLGDVRVALYENATAKVNTYLAGKDPGFVITPDIEISYPVFDGAEEFVSVIEARAKGTDIICHRGVHVHKKRGAQAGVQQATF